MVLGIHSSESWILKVGVMFLCGYGVLSVLVFVLVMWMVRIPVVWWCFDWRIILTFSIGANYLSLGFIDGVIDLITNQLAAWNIHGNIEHLRHRHIVFLIQRPFFIWYFIPYFPNEYKPFSVFQFDDFF